MEAEYAGRITCSSCGNTVEDDDDFCPHCGAIFSDFVFCDKHRHAEAEGVCVICAVPCCKECGTVVGDIFLCNLHRDYEIYEGMVKVYGTHDEADSEAAKSRLGAAGLHPVLFHLHRSKDRGHLEYEVYEAGEDFNPSEIRVMVPCEEVDEAEKILKLPPTES